MPEFPRCRFVGGRRRTAQGHGLPSMSERFTVTTAGRLQHFRQENLLALAILPRRRDVSHSHTALNCLLCCCVLHAFATRLAGALYPPRVIQQASVRNTRLAHAVERSVVMMQALHHQHIAKKSSLHLPRNSTDIITVPLSFFPFMRSLSTLCITN